MKYAWWLGQDIIEIINNLLIMVVFFQCKINKRSQIPVLVICIHIPIWSFIVLHGSYTSKIFGTLLCVMCSVFIILDEKIAKKGLLFFASYTLLGCLEGIIAWVIKFVYYLIFNRQIEEKIESGWQEIGLEIAVFIFLLITILGTSKIRKNQSMKMPKQTIVLLSMLMVCYAIIIYYIIESANYVKNVYLNVVTFFMVVAVAIIMTVYIIHYMIIYYSKIFYEQQNSEQQKVISLQKQCLHSIESNYEKIRGMHHDMKHMIGSLAIMMEQKEYNEANDYLAKWREDLNLTKYEKITEIGIVDATLYYAKEKALKDNIKLQIQSCVKDWRGINPYNLCTILLNGLTNAIEATLESEGKEEKNIYLKMIRNNNALYISIQNSSVRVAEEIQVGVTTKLGDGHGYGIRNILDIVEKYNGEMKYIQKGKDIQLEICLFL